MKKTLDASKFDSGATDYFLILNSRNKSIVQKRQNAKMEEDANNSFGEFDKEFFKE